mgnify:CR=1 FL=1
MRVESKRLLIDDVKLRDKEDYFLNISHDKEVLKTFVCNYAEDLESFDFSRNVGRDDIFAIRLADTGKLIGIFVEYEVNKDKKCLEIGYGIGSAHWGKGYMTEVVRAMLTYYFTQTDFQTVYASFFPENIASKRVMEKCGMTFSHIHEKEFSYLGKERDLIYYKIEAR